MCISGRSFKCSLIDDFRNNDLFTADEPKM